MARRCPGAVPLGRATLDGWRFLVSADGYASIAREPASKVHGALWRVGEDELRRLDAFEAVHMGVYRRETMRVVGPDGPVRAVVYVGRTERPGLAVGGYMELVLNAAREWELPEAYVAEIARFGAGPRGLARRNGGF